MRELLKVIERDLRNTRAAGLDDDWRFQIAYNAALQTANAALNATGFAVAKGDSAHVKAIQSLSHTMEAAPADVATLEAFRKKRRISTYEIAGQISKQEASEITGLATRLHADLLVWLKAKHPHLLSAK